MKTTHPCTPFAPCASDCPGITGCRRAYNRSNMARKREAMAAAGLCLWCRAKAENGRVLCAECAKAGAAACREWRRKKKINRRCITCGQSARFGRVRCGICLESNRLDSAWHRQQKEIDREQRMPAGRSVLPQMRPQPSR